MAGLSLKQGINSDQTRDRANLNYPKLPKKKIRKKKLDLSFLEGFPSARFAVGGTLETTFLHFFWLSYKDKKSIVK
jgi:hypothetical protein